MAREAYVLKEVPLGLGVWDRTMREKGSLEGKICVIHWGCGGGCVSGLSMWSAAQLVVRLGRGVDLEVFRER